MILVSDSLRPRVTSDVLEISLVYTSALRYTRDIFGCRRLYHGYTKYMFAPHRYIPHLSALVRDIHVLTYSV